MPVKNRGKALVTLTFMTSIGKLISLSLGYHYLQSTSDWMGLIFALAIISIASPILVILFVSETPRYHLAINDIKGAIEELNHMGKTNRGKDY